MAGASFRVTVIGSLNADLVMRVPRFPVAGETLRGTSFHTFPGGKGGNQACAVARLGADVRLLAQVGADAHGTWLLEAMRATGVDTRGVRVDSVETGVALILIDEAGRNQITIVPGANGTFTSDRIDLSLLDGSRALLCQLETPLETTLQAARWARQQGQVVVLDPAPARPVPDELLALVDYVTPNETELALLDGRAPLPCCSEAEALPMARRLLSRGVRKVVVKRSEQGVLLVDDEKHISCPAFEVAAVDTTAAGDAFNGSFAFALCDGADEQQALRFACASAAVSVTRPGAQPSMPVLAEVQDLLQRLQGPGAAR